MMRSDSNSENSASWPSDFFELGGCSSPDDTGRDGGDSLEPLPLTTADDGRIDGVQSLEREINYSSQGPRDDVVGAKQREAVLTPAEDFVGSLGGEHFPDVFTSSSSLHTSRRKKKPKGNPKRPLSAYNFFFKLERERLMRSGRIGFSELGKIIGNHWSNLPESERKKYKDLAEKDAKRYHEEMKNFRQEEELRSSSANEDTKHPPFCLDSDLSLEHESSTRRRPGRRRPSKTSRSSRGSYDPLSWMGGDMRFSVGSTGDSSFPLASQQPQLPVSPGFLEGRPMLAPGVAPVALPQNTVAAGQQTLSPSSNPFLPPTRQETTVSLPRHQGFPSDAVPLPPGTELVLPDADGIERQFVVNYACFMVTPEEASRYMDSLPGGFSINVGLPPEFVQNDSQTDRVRGNECYGAG